MGNIETKTIYSFMYNTICSILQDYKNKKKNIGWKTKYAILKNITNINFMYETCNHFLFRHTVYISTYIQCLKIYLNSNIFLNINLREFAICVFNTLKNLIWYL